MGKLKVCHLCAGVGAPEMALKRLGIDFDNVGYSEIDKFAIKSYTAIHGEQPALGNLEEIQKLPECNLLFYGTPCLTGDTLVFTKNKGYIPITEVTEQDEVIGHDGKYHKVLALLEQGEKPTYKVVGMGIDEIRCTPNHQFYVRRMSRVWDNAKRTYCRQFSQPEWKDCKDLEPTYDYLGVPVNTINEIPDWEGVYYNNHEHALHNQLPLDSSDFWYFVGRFIGDGWVCKRKDRNNSPSKVVICCGKHEVEEFENKIKGFHYSKVEERTVFKYHISNKELGTFLLQFGHRAHNKKIPYFVYNLPVKLLNAFLSGYTDSDGYITLANTRIASVSRELIYGIALCVAKVHQYPSSIHKAFKSPKHIIEGREVNQRPIYSISFHPKKTQDHAFFEDGFIWYPVRKVIPTGNIETVYDLMVEDAHSFVANNCIVHNCQNFSIAGDKAGVIDDKGQKTRSGLLLDVERLLITAKEENNLPEILVMENVKNLVGTQFKPYFESWLQRLEEFGYNNYWQVLNSKNYGVPQSRDRVFVVSIRQDIDKKGYVFPEPIELKTRVKDILETNVPEHYYLSQHTIEKIAKSKFHSERDRIIKGDICQTLRARDFKDPVCVKEPKVNQIANYLEGEGNYWKNPNNGRIYSKEGLAPTINTMEGGNRQPKIVEGDESFENDFRVRKLTEGECWRLMGFSEEDINKVKAVGISRSQMYKQAGNSIVVDVLYYIFKNLPLDSIINL